MMTYLNQFHKEAFPTPQIAIDTYMAALGFNRLEQVSHYANDIYTVWELIPRRSALPLA